MTVHERRAYESADPIDSIQTLETIGIRWLDFYPFSRDKNEGPVIVMKESPVAGSLLSSLDVGDAAPSMHPNASCDAQDTVKTQCDSYIFLWR